MDQAVGRAVAILEALVAASEPMRLTRLAEEVGLQKSTAHRLLKTWIELGFVQQEPEGGRYGPTLRVWELGSAVAIHHPIKRAAAGFLQALHRETGETVSLVVPTGDDVLYLDKLFSPRPVRFSTRPGSRVPAPLTVGGAAILAHHPDSLGVVERVAATPAGRGVDMERFLGELEVVRRRGYSKYVSEAGSVGFGCPLLDRSGAAVAALSVSAPAERVTPKSQELMLQALITTCASLAEMVGPL